MKGIFKLKENGTTVGKEVVAGLTTFLRWRISLW